MAHYENEVNDLSSAIRKLVLENRSKKKVENLTDENVLLHMQNPYGRILFRVLEYFFLRVCYAVGVLFFTSAGQFYRHHLASLRSRQIR